MKSAFILGFLIAILELTHSSRFEPSKVYAEILGYGRQRASILPPKRGGENQRRCYETFIPKVTELAERGKTESEICIAGADGDREEELQKVQDQRSALNALIQNIRDSLNKCTDEEDVIKYLTCLSNDAEENRAALTEIEETSLFLQQQLDESFVAIQLVENRCISSVIDKAKLDTDSVFDALQDCLINGYVEPQTDPTATEEPQTEATEEPDPQPGQESTPVPESNRNPEEDIE